MLYDVIEYHWKTNENISIWKWLGITQVTWSQQKKNGVSQKHIDKVMEFFDVDMTNDELLVYITNNHKKL